MPKIIEFDRHKIVFAPTNVILKKLLVKGFVYLGMGYNVFSLKSEKTEQVEDKRQT